MPKELNRPPPLTSLSARRAWIEINLNLPSSPIDKSLSARRAWIEIGQCHAIACIPCVALRKESVDRNPMAWGHTRRAFMVALRKESVDRNSLSTPTSQTSPVALRKESVDRNSIVLASIRGCILSLSARRAWIEIRWLLAP